MEQQERFEKLGKSIRALSDELIYSKQTTLYIYICLLMKKLSLDEEIQPMINWQRILNSHSKNRVEAFYKAFKNLKKIKGMAFLSKLKKEDLNQTGLFEENQPDIILNAIIPPVNEVESFDREGIYALFKTISRVLSNYSKQNTSQIILNDFYYDLIYAMMDLKKGSSVYVFGTLDRNFIVETLYRHWDKALSLHAQIDDFMDYLITKILFYLFEADSSTITNEDFITTPKFQDNGFDFKEFDYVVSASIIPKQKQMMDIGQTITEDQSNRFTKSRMVKGKEVYPWAVVDNGIASLKENGKFFDFMPATPLVSGTCSGARRNLIESRIKSAVYQLNSPKAKQRKSSLHLVVFEKVDDIPKDVFMANFSEMYDGTSIENLTDYQKQAIIETAVNFKKQKNFSNTIGINELKENNVSLSPSNYLFKMPEMSKEEQKLFDSLNKGTDKIYLDEVAEVFKGRTIQKIDKDKIRKKGGSVHLLKSSDIPQRGLIDCNHCDKIQLSKKSVDKYASKFLKPDDLVLPSAGNIERIGMIPELPKHKNKPINLLPDSNLVIIRTDSHQYSPTLLYNILKGPYGKYILQKISKGSGKGTVNTEVLKKAKLPMIGRDKQQQFQEKLMGINEKIKGYRDKVSELEKKKETLLNQVINDN